MGRIVVDSFDEIDRLATLTAGPVSSAQQVLVRVTPGVEAHTHEFVRTGQEDSKFGFGLASGAAAEAVARLRALPGRGARRRPRPHRQPDLPGGVVRRGGRGAGRVLRPRSGCPSCAWAAGSGVAVRRRGAGADASPSGPRTVHEACRAAGIPAGDRITAEPGRAIVATAGMTLYRVGTIKELPGRPDLRGGRRRHERQPPPGALRQRLRGVPRRGPPACPATPGGPRRGQALRVRRHGGGRRPAARPTWPWATSWPRPVTGAYGYSMASNYNKVPRPGRGLRGRRRRPGGGAARDRRRSGPPRRLSSPVEGRSSPGPRRCRDGRGWAVA